MAGQPGTMQQLPMRWYPAAPVPTIAPMPPSKPTCRQLLEDGGLEGGGLQLANLGGRNVLPSDGELCGQVGARRGNGCNQLGAGAVSLAGRGG